MSVLFYTMDMIRNVTSFWNRLWTLVSTRTKRLWKQFRLLKRRYQVIIVAILLLLIIAIIALARSGGAETALDQSKTVTLATVGSLSGGEGGVNILGTVRSITEANVLAQAGGTVQRVHTSINSKVPAGFIILELDNASESAAVLQAQGVYEGAIAARNISGAQTGEAKTAALTTYRSIFTSLDGSLKNQVDSFFGVNTAVGPQLLISPGQVPNLPSRRASITASMDTWRANLAVADSQDPAILLSQAGSTLQTVSSFLVDLAVAANKPDSQATATQIANLATARATVDGLLASLSVARDSYNAKKTAGDDTGATAGAQAQVKQALGALRGAQANLEKKLVRAPISGTINFLPSRVGDYVTPLMHVATVAQNGALEIVAYVGESERENLAVGMKVRVEEKYDGIITTVAPALDPVTKQIEVHVAVDTGSALVNGQSVRISLPGSVIATTTAQTGPVLLPLTAVKLQADKRTVFSVDADGRLVAHEVTIGTVRGDKIEILSPLSSDMQIVVDARGLADGEKVQIADVTRNTL